MSGAQRVRTAIWVAVDPAVAEAAEYRLAWRLLNEALYAELGTNLEIELVHIAGPDDAATREALLDRAVRTTRSLLNIGCGIGAFGAAAAQTLGCRVVGIELIPSIARIAAQQLDRVLTGDALSLEIEERFDCVTCLDVLEHVAEPERLLERIRERFLAAEGHLVASVPNVGHWSLALDQIAGRWDYVPAGLLCETHLRFFTEHSLHALLSRQGFEISTLHRVKLPAPANVHKRLASLREAGFEVNAASLDTLAFHLVARCVR
ncbi:class I SAM-dependent methyltransferase [uncultured Thiohalocapsa sp.]|uniref:class I SAM-dependent methyltransferase n=1 Tax=uncultured Thiohalocapsa sp. TaxID=768990 RepID=UPI0025D21698|nr:class I SAM-dependent methyltransferase [uncultured Thiohalocapsa sp.]